MCIEKSNLLAQALLTSCFKVAIGEDQEKLSVLPHSWR
jgi:hypothetical protein